MPIRIYSMALLNMDQVDEAIKWSTKLWVVNPTDVANANNLAWMLAVHRKDYAKAGEIIDRCKRLMPNNPDLLDTAGWIEFLWNKYREASDDLQASIKYGDNAEARYHLGRWTRFSRSRKRPASSMRKPSRWGWRARDSRMPSSASSIYRNHNPERPGTDARAAFRIE